MPQSISFSHAKAESLERALKVKFKPSLSDLDFFLDCSKLVISDPLIQNQLENIAKKSYLNIENWTEQELVMKHISPIINLIDYSSEEYNSFADRTFGYQFEELRLNGAMDFLVATGRGTPRTPYFCLHEYKKEQNFEGEPRGQLLAEMLVAQALNRDAKTRFETIYGCYIVGRNWFWVILKDKEYAVSRAYDSTRIGDLSEIYLILVKIKYIIEDHIAQSKK
jgi:hypothetical protein